LSGIDVVAQYSFGKSYRRLEKEDFDPVYAQSMHEGTAAFHFNKQFFWPFKAFISLPGWIVTKIVPGLYTYIELIHDCERQIRSIIAASKDGHPEKQVGDGPTTVTIFHELLRQENVPARERSMGRLVQEAQIVVSAGTETVSWCLSVITFHLLSQPALLRKLRRELEDAIPDPQTTVPVEKLEQLPYLTACIQEGLRLSYGLSTRLARVSPDEVLVFKDGVKEWEIPPGVSSTHPISVHLLVSQLVNKGRLWLTIRRLQQA
jgi:Cytochrome P450